jgi:hypothetical protein
MYLKIAALLLVILAIFLCGFVTARYFDQKKIASLESKISVYQVNEQTVSDNIKACRSTIDNLELHVKILQQSAQDARDSRDEAERKALDERAVLNRKIAEIMARPLPADCEDAVRATAERIRNAFAAPR